MLLLQRLTVLESTLGTWCKLKTAMEKPDPPVAAGASPETVGAEVASLALEAITQCKSMVGDFTLPPSVLHTLWKRWSTALVKARDWPAWCSALVASPATEWGNLPREPIVPHLREHVLQSLIDVFKVKDQTHIVKAMLDTIMPVVSTLFAHDEGFITELTNLSKLVFVSRASHSDLGDLVKLRDTMSDPKRPTNSCFVIVLTHFLDLYLLLTRTVSSTWLAVAH